MFKVSGISSDLPCTDGDIQFTTVPLNTLSDQVWIIYQCLYFWKLIIFNCGCSISYSLTPFIINSLIPYSFHSFLIPLILSFILCYVNPSLLLNPSSLELMFFYFLPKYTLLLPTLLISRIRLTDTHTDISKIRPTFYPLSPPPSKLLTVSTSLSRP